MKPFLITIAIIVLVIVVGHHVFGLFGGTNIFSGEKKQSPALGGVIMDSPGSRCQCYCSDKCGPRDRKEGIDRPFVDRETGLCFCLPRDKANYIPNRCTPKTFANSCCA